MSNKAVYQLSARQIILLAFFAALAAVAVTSGLYFLKQSLGTADPSTITLAENAPVGISDPSAVTDEQNSIEVYKAISPGVAFINTTTYQQDFWGGVYHLAMPAVTLSTPFMALILRTTRATLVEVMEQPYIAAALARGEPGWRVVWVHGMRNVLMPLVTIIGLQLGSLLHGAVLTETVFSLPGVGRMITDAVLNREYLVVQAGVMMTGCLIILTNLAVDLAYPLLDPRLRPR